MRFQKVKPPCNGLCVESSGALIADAARMEGHLSIGCGWWKGRYTGVFWRSLLPFLTCIYGTLLDLEIYRVLRTRGGKVDTQGCFERLAC